MKKMFAKLEFKGRTHETSTPNPDDSWDRASTSTDWEIPTTFTVSNQDEYKAEPLNFSPIEGSQYFMVYAIWSTGDSFGQDDRNYCESFGVFKTYKQAQKKVAELTVWTSAPWKGYFESLDTLDIQSIVCVG